jgi:hypothetical protein
MNESHDCGHSKRKVTGNEETGNGEKTELLCVRVQSFRWAMQRYHASLSHDNGV